VDTGQAWLAAAGTVAAAIFLGVLVAPGLVWDRFLWRYFWGPVYADANHAACAVMRPGGPERLFASDACTEAAATGAIVAEPGYTVVSEIGYAVTLIFFLIGVLELLRRLDVGESKRLFYALVPFMFFGGALRVVEDADNAVPQGVGDVLSYPLNALIISPVIYFTVFFLTLAGLVVAVYADREGLVPEYGRPLAAYGRLLLLATVAFLLYFVPTTLEGEVPSAGIYPQMTVLTLGLAAVLAAGTYVAVDRVRPSLHEGTGLVGLVVLFGHAVDGVANVLASDWMATLGIPIQYGSKHPVNEFIIRTTASVQPETMTAVVGSSWPFLVVKLAAATLVIVLFDRRIFEESPRYAVLLLIAILAVGLGPGTRDMLRATFGI
jgi:uncharacterized membrane protein